jgi:hypothetical protein
MSATADTRGQQTSILAKRLLRIDKDMNGDVLKIPQFAGFVMANSTKTAHDGLMKTCERVMQNAI